MAHTNVVAGAGTTIAFQSGLLANIEDFDWSGISREAIPTTHMGTTGGDTFIPASTYDPGSLTATIQFDKENATQAATFMTAAAEAVTVAFAGSDKYSASAFATDFGITGATKEKIMATVGLKFSGGITYTTSA